MDHDTLYLAGRLRRGRRRRCRRYRLAAGGGHGAGNRTLVLSGTYRITGAIVLPGNIEIRGTGAGQVLTSTTDIPLFSAALQSGIRIIGVHFKQTAAGANAYVAGVTLDRCTHCLVEGCEFEGMQWSGVYLSNASHNTISNNYFHDFIGTVWDGADITVMNESSYNRISGNRCFGGCDHGILVQDPYVGLLPKKNLISGNHVGEHDGYGIAVYVPGAGDTYNTVCENDIEDILGNHASGASGAGIYVVGPGCGGTVVSNNNVRNCCRETTARNLAPAAIGISGVQLGAARVVVSGNNIDDMQQGDGILVTSSMGGVTITGNAVRMPAGNNGTGPGGLTLLGTAIRVDASSNTVVAGNTIENLASTAAILAYASGDNIANLVVSANNVVSGGVAIRVARLGSFTASDCAISANSCRSTATDGLQLQGINRGSVSNNTIGSAGGIPVYMVDCLGVRLSGNTLNASGAVGYQTGGTCTGSFYDLSNRHNGSIVNNAAGSMVEFFTASAPTSGTGAVGDRAVRSAPSASAPDYWRCVAAGSPGTWKAGANLSA